MNKPLQIALVATALVLIPVDSAEARSGGISGHSGRQGPTCSDCHQGNAFPGAQATISMPSVVAPSDIVNITVTMEASSPAAGFNLAASEGTFSAPGAGARLLDGEVTHNAPKNLVGGSTSWTVMWQAPAQTGTKTLYVCSNPVNLNGVNTGDGLRACTTRTVTVTQDMGGADCDAGFVQMSGTQIDIGPTGVDDTANFQCALDTAAADNIPLVKLQNAEYFVSEIYVNGFVGKLEGTTRAGTIVNILDFSMDCEAMVAQGLLPAAMKFAVGEPTLRLMTINAATPCSSGADLNALLHFSSNPLNCNQKTAFVLVDRVDLAGAGINSGIQVGVAITDSDCGAESRINGTFKLNRAEVSGFTVGLALGMSSASQVDVNFSGFQSVETAISIMDANQSTTITRNTFAVGGPDGGADPIGVLIGTASASAPTTNRTVIYNNDFTVSNGQGIALIQPGRRATQSVAITSNTFDMDDFNGAVCIHIADADAGVIQSNIFRGASFRCIEIGAFDFGQNVVDWGIIGNNFNNMNSNLTDISLQTMTRDNIVGPSQGASISDSTGQNFQLGTSPSSVSSANLVAVPAGFSRMDTTKDDMAWPHQSAVNGQSRIMDMLYSNIFGTH